MTTKQLSYQHIIRPSKVETANPIPLFMLHGYGSNEDDLFSFSEQLPDNLFIISVRAPYTLAAGGYSWYDIYFDENTDKWSNDEQAITSKDGILQFIEEACSGYGLDIQKVSLMGFSQGAILGYAIALSFPKKIKNLLALSGYINPKITNQSFEKNDLFQLNIYASHGTQDMVIPYSLAEETKRLLDNTNSNVVFESYPSGHTVSLENFQSFQAWISRHLV